jgi:ribonuclease Z
MRIGFFCFYLYFIFYNMKFEVTILGTAAATPAYGRFPTSQVLNIQDQWYMIDCGEGTQMRLTDFHIPRNRINHIFISHLHGDHVFGLPGLLTSMSLNGRQEAMHIYSPIGLEEMIHAMLRLSDSHLLYPLHFHVTNTEQHELIYENDGLTVHSIPLLHSVPCAGFLFKEKPFLPNFIKEKIAEYNIPVSEIMAIKAGKDFVTSDGQTIPNSELVTPAVRSRSYAFCSDTMYNEAIIPIIENIDMLYHETTFTQQFLENAEWGMHSTAHQAATIAKKANVKMLITGHYSARFPDFSDILQEAQAVFPNTFASMDGFTFNVPYRS